MLCPDSLEGLFLNKPDQPIEALFNGLEVSVKLCSNNSKHSKTECYDQATLSDLQYKLSTDLYII